MPSREVERCSLGKMQSGCVEQPTRVSPEQLGATVPESAQVLLTDALGFFARTLNVSALLPPASVEKLPLAVSTAENSHQ